MLGTHWIADATECAAERLDVDGVREALIELPTRLGLKRVSDPLLFDSTEAGRERSVAGIVLLAESHASVHAFPDRRALHVDVFSCRALDVAVARTFIVSCFGAKTIDERLLERGA